MAAKCIMQLGILPTFTHNSLPVVLFQTQECKEAHIWVCAVELASFLATSCMCSRTSFLTGNQLNCNTMHTHHMHGLLQIHSWSPSYACPFKLLEVGACLPPVMPQNLPPNFLLTWCDQQISLPSNQTSIKKSSSKMWDEQLLQKIVSQLMYWVSSSRRQSSSGEVTTHTDNPAIQCSSYSERNGAARIRTGTQATDTIDATLPEVTSWSWKMHRWRVDGFCSHLWFQGLNIFTTFATTLK